MTFVPGKIIISGEHSVVYGKLALAASVGKGVRVKVVNDNFINNYSEIVKMAIELAGASSKLNLVIDSELPVGSGMGSSAAVAAATIKAVRTYLGKKIEKDELFELTMTCEKLAHGNPSGVDPATVIYGGLIAYIKGHPFEKLQIVRPLNLLLIDTGKPTESTSEMVKMVAEKLDKDAIIEEMGYITMEIKNGLISGKEVKSQINTNGLLLEKLGIVSKNSINLSQKLRKLGYAVKVTGAGGVTNGSGTMLVMGEDFARAKEIFDDKNIRYFETKIGET